MSARLFKTKSGLESFLATRKGPLLVRVLHDRGAYCSPGSCRCKPWFEVSPATPEALINGVELEVAWRRRVAS